MCLLWSCFLFVCSFSFFPQGRTGLMICCYLCYTGQYGSVDEVLKFYARARTHNDKVCIEFQFSFHLCIHIRLISERFFIIVLFVFFWKLRIGVFRFLDCGRHFFLETNVEESTSEANSFGFHDGLALFLVPTVLLMAWFLCRVLRSKVRNVMSDILLNFLKLDTREKDPFFWSTWKYHQSQLEDAVCNFSGSCARVWVVVCSLFFVDMLCYSGKWEFLRSLRNHLKLFLLLFSFCRERYQLVLNRLHVSCTHKEPNFKISHIAGTPLFHYKDHVDLISYKESDVEMMLDCGHTPLCGDIKFEVYNGKVNCLFFCSFLSFFSVFFCHIHGCECNGLCLLSFVFIICSVRIFRGLVSIVYFLLVDFFIQK